MAAAADWLDRRAQLGQDVFARGRSKPAWAEKAGTAHATAGASAPIDKDADSPAAEESDDLTDLLRACLVALRLPSHTQVYQPRRLVFWSVSDATKRITQMMQALPAGAALEEFLPTTPGQGANRLLHRRAALAATLIAGLELARGGVIALEQGAIWTPIMMGLGSGRR